jgi:hypothetical protein
MVFPLLYCHCAHVYSFAEVNQVDLQRASLLSVYTCCAFYLYGSERVATISAPVPSIFATITSPAVIGAFTVTCVSSFSMGHAIERGMAQEVLTGISGDSACRMRIVVVIIRTGLKTSASA